MTDAVAKIVLELIKQIWAVVKADISEAEKLARLERVTLALTAEQVSDAAIDRLLK